MKSFIIDQSRKEFLKDEQRYCKILGIKSATAELYQIGYIPDNGLAPILWESGYSHKEYSELNLENIHNRFLFPSHSPKGSVNAFHFKRNDYSDQPIWITHGYEEGVLYGADKCNSRLNYIMLVDGIDNVLACTNAHISNVVAFTDDAIPTTEQVEFIKSYENVIVAFSKDEWGKKSKGKVKESLLNDYIYELDFEGTDISAALKDLTQRRLIINQIKTITIKNR